MSSENNKKGFTRANLSRLFFTRRVFICLGVIIALILFWRVAFGDYIGGQPNFSYSWTLPVGHLIRQTLGNSFTNQVLNSIEIKADTTNPNSKIQIKKNNSEWVAEWFLTASSTNFLTFSSSTPLTLTTGDSFDLYLLDFTGYGDAVIYGSNDPDSYTYGVCGTSYPGGGEPNNPCGSVADIYFSLITNINTISLNYPVNNSTTTNFTAWETTGYSLINWQHLTILCGPNSNDLTICGQELLGIGGFGGHLTPNFETFTAGTYYAQAQLSYTSPGSLTEPPETIITATSTKISFEIVAGPTYQNFPSWYPTSTASSSEWVITCDPESGFFQNSLCKLGLYLFLPNQGDFNKFSNLKDILSAKPPVGYFYAIKNALSGLGATSTKAFQIASLGPISTYIFDPLKIGFIVIMWLVFGVWLFNRIRNLEL